MAEQRYQAVLAVIADGLSVSQVADKVGVSRQTSNYPRFCSYSGARAGVGWLAGCEVPVRAAGTTRWWDVAEGFVQAFLVVPGHPFGGREFDVDASPRLAAVDQFGLVGGVDCFSEGVVVTIAARPHLWGDPELDQPVGIGQR